MTITDDEFADEIVRRLNQCTYLGRLPDDDEEIDGDPEPPRRLMSTNIQFLVDQAGLLGFLNELADDIDGKRPRARIEVVREHGLLKFRRDVSSEAPTLQVAIHGYVQKQAIEIEMDAPGPQFGRVLVKWRVPDDKGPEWDGSFHISDRENRVGVHVITSYGADVFAADCRCVFWHMGWSKEHGMIAYAEFESIGS